MRCRTHPSVTGVNTCNQCGEWLCDACTVEINGRIFCRGCLAKLAHGPDGPPAPAPAYTRPRRINGGLLFIFSCMPSGINYMFMGLIKRGLAAMAGFFLLIFLVSAFNIWPFNLIFGLSIPVFYLTCLFDGFNIRRRINAGEAVRDDVEDFAGFVRHNKNRIITASALLMLLALAGSVFTALPDTLRNILPILLLLAALYVLFQRPKRRRDDDGNA